MAKEREKLGYELSLGHGFSLADVVQNLQGKDFDPEEEYFEFLIRGEITRENLRPLLYLPYEVSMYEAGERIVLATAKSHSGCSEEEIFKRLRRTLSHLHTHPIRDGAPAVDTPSFTDALGSGAYPKTATLALAHPNGVMIYRPPFFDPVKKRPERDAKEIIFHYCLADGIDVFGYEIKGTRPYSDLSEAEQIKMERDFAEKTGMIVDEATWDDKSGLERVLGKIFVDSLQSRYAVIFPAPESHLIEAYNKSAFISSQ